MPSLKSKPLEWVRKQLDAGVKVLPDYDRIFYALSFFPPNQTKVIIIGQDPYPKAEHAMGLAFSSKHYKQIPASLRNIFKELVSDVKVSYPKTGDLTPWANQGVLLLNSILTVEEGKSASHTNKGWEEYTESVINKVLKYETPLVIICWGKYARSRLTNLKIHDKVLVLSGGHPSPLNTTGDFSGGKYFSKANEWLNKYGVPEINWTL